MTWREKFSPIIARVIAENRDKPLSEQRKALRAAFPAGERKYHPYKIWLDEINVQLGRKKIAERAHRRQVTPPAAGQRELFG